MERIVDDVVDGRLVLLLRFDHFRPVATAEDVVLPLVALVEGAGIGTVQIAHPICEVRQWRLDQEVVVVAHQAAHVSEPAVAPFDPAQDVEEDDSVSIVEDDRRVVVAPDPDVVVGARGEVTVGPSHLPKVALRKARGLRCDAFAPGPTRSRHVPGTRLGRTGRRLEGRVAAGLVRAARRRLWSARDADATGSSRAPEGACAGTACPCASSRGSGPRRRPALRTRSAPR
ncbi:MAG: hypothetical protein V7645_3050 [Actinomycetota bacterium]